MTTSAPKPTPAAKSSSGGVTDIKCVVIGDGAVGKTCMLLSFTQNAFPQTYVATVFDNMEKMMAVDGKTVRLQLWDTAGQEEYDRLRNLCFPQSDLFLICYAVDSKASLKNVVDKWYPEIKQYRGPNVAVILVCTKIDLRDEFEKAAKNPSLPAEEKQKVQQQLRSLVPHEEGEKVARELGLTRHVECSARTQKGLTEVFQTAVRCVLNPQKVPTASTAKKGACCTIL